MDLCPASDREDHTLASASLLVPALRANRSKHSFVGCTLYRRFCGRHSCWMSCDLTARSSPTRWNAGYAQEMLAVFRSRPKDVS